MPRIRVLAVGRLKTPHWQEAARHYLSRFSPSFRVEEHIVKDADPKFGIPDRKRQEAALLVKALRPSETLMCLDEKGKSLTSTAFAELLRSQFDTGKTPCFVVGGAYGLDESILDRAQHKLAFGPMTFPHELARVLLFEQLYRAQNILAGTGYHH